MSRRRSAQIRDIEPDPKYNDYMVAKFINSLLKQGKKSIAERILYNSMERLDSKVDGVNGLELFKTAIENIKPKLEVYSRRVGGSNYQVPIEVRDRRKLTLAIRWIIQSAKARNGKSMVEKLTSELLDAYHKQGAAFKKKEDTYKMAEANRAFAHYSW